MYIFFQKITVIVASVPLVVEPPPCLPSQPCRPSLQSPRPQVQAVPVELACGQLRSCPLAPFLWMRKKKKRSIPIRQRLQPERS